MNGQVVNTVIQVTSDPPRVAVIINKPKGSLMGSCVIWGCVNIIMKISESDQTHLKTNDVIDKMHSEMLEKSRRTVDHTPSGPVDVKMGFSSETFFRGPGDGGHEILLG